MLQKSGSFSRFNPAHGREDCREDGQAGQSHYPHGLQAGPRVFDCLDLVKSYLVPGVLLINAYLLPDSTDSKGKATTEPKLYVHFAHVQ